MFILKPLKNILGYSFRGVIRDEIGNAVMEILKDVEGNAIKQTPRGKNGEPLPGASPEIVYRAKTRELKEDALPDLLKSFYLNIPPDKFTRLDSIMGVKLFDSINKIKDNILELPEDVHDWIKKKLQLEISKDEVIGTRIFGIDLAIIENALDDFEKPHEPQEKK